MVKAVGTQLYGVSHMAVAHDSICFAHISPSTQTEAGNHQGGHFWLIESRDLQPIPRLDPPTLFVYRGWKNYL